MCVDESGITARPAASTSCGGRPRTPHHVVGLRARRPPVLGSDRGVREPEDLALGRAPRPTPRGRRQHADVADLEGSRPASRMLVLAKPPVGRPLLRRAPTNRWRCLPSASSTPSACPSRLFAVELEDLMEGLQDFCSVSRKFLLDLQLVDRLLISAERAGRGVSAARKSAGLARPLRLVARGVRTSRRPLPDEGLLEDALALRTVVSYPAPGLASPRSALRGPATPCPRPW
jgi:hypothetical protein